MLLPSLSGSAEASGGWAERSAQGDGIEGVSGKAGRGVRALPEHLQWASGPCLSGADRQQ